MRLTAANLEQLKAAIARRASLPRLTGERASTEAEHLVEAAAIGELAAFAPELIAEVERLTVSLKDTIKERDDWRHKYRELARAVRKIKEVYYPAEEAVGDLLKAVEKAPWPPDED